MLLFAYTDESTPNNRFETYEEEKEKRSRGFAGAILDFGVGSIKTIGKSVIGGVVGVSRFIPGSTQRAATRSKSNASELSPRERHKRTGSSAIDAGNAEASPVPAHKEVQNNAPVPTPVAVSGQLASSAASSPRSGDNQCTFPRKMPLCISKINACGHKYSELEFVRPAADATGKWHERVD